MPLDFRNINLRDSQTQQMLVVIPVALIAFVLYLYFIFVPQIIRVVTLVGKTGKIKTEIKSATSAIAEMDGLKNKLREYNEKVELYEKKLPVEQEIPSLLENLSNMAKGANIKITSIMPVVSESSAQQQSRLYKEIPIRITAKSGYHELGHFLSELENADRFMKVTELGIKSNKSSPKLHEVELKVCTYVLLPER